MKDNLYLELLTLLEEHAVTGFFDISSITNKLYLNPMNPGDTILVPNIRQEKIHGLLSLIEKAGYIFLINSSPDNISKEWVVPIKFEAMITPQGLKYLVDYRVSMSNLEVNETSLKTYEIQKWGTFTTIAIALIVAIISILTYNKPEPKMVELNNNIMAISKELSALKEQIHIQTKILPSAKEKKN